jgi:hypothetical protein
VQYVHAVELLYHHSLIMHGTVSQVRTLYVEKLKEIFEQFADKYAPNRTSDFKVVN